MWIPENIRMIARKLRNNMTESEKLIWEKIRRNRLWYKVLRQKPFFVYSENFNLDRYIIPDFYIAKKKLLIEIDWNVHNLPEILILDKYKEKLIKNRWFRIIRITNEEIKNNINLVIKNILQMLEE